MTWTASAYRRYDAEQDSRSTWDALCFGCCVPGFRKTCSRPRLSYQLRDRANYGLDTLSVAASVGVGARHFCLSRSRQCDGADHSQFSRFM